MLESGGEWYQGEGEAEWGEWKWSLGSGIASDEGKLLPNPNAQIDEHESHKAADELYAIGRYPDSMTCLRRVIHTVIVTTTTRIFPRHLETAESDFAVAKTDCCQVVPDAWN